MARTKRYIVVIILFVLANLFISKVPYGGQVKLKKSLSLIPSTVGSWTGVETITQKNSLPSLVDKYFFREYVSTGRQSLFLEISYLGKFKHGADIFSGNHIDPGLFWDPVSEQNIFIEHEGEKIPVKKIVFAKGNSYISLIYWYDTNHGITTRRFAGRLTNGMDAILNRMTGVALIKIISKPYLNKMPPEAELGQLDFTKKVFPLLTDFFPFEV